MALDDFKHLFRSSIHYSSVVGTEVSFYLFIFLLKQKQQPAEGAQDN